MRFRHIVIGATSVACIAVAAPGWAAGVIGARAGVSVAKASVDASATFDEANRTGFAGTAFLSTGLAGVVLQPEISFIQKGVGDVKLDYMEAAALLKFGVPLIPVLKPHAFVGVGADYEVNEKSQLPIDTAKLDWNAIFGADLFIVLGQISLVADVRYAHGLKDIQDTAGVVTGIKNRAWLLSAGVGCNF